MKGAPARARKAAPAPEPGADPRVAAARRELLEGVGAEIAASFPGITRLGGQVVAALYLAESPRSMDELAAELGYAKSNVFGNLRALEGAGIVERRREPGARNDVFALRGKYPDVIIGAYVARLRRVVWDKLDLTARSLALLGDAKGPEAEALRVRLADLRRKYELFARLMESYVPSFEGPIDLERIFSSLPLAVWKALATAAKGALGLGDAARKKPGR